MSQNLNDTKNLNKNAQIQTNTSKQQNIPVNNFNNGPISNQGEHSQRANDLDLGEFVTVTKDMCIDYTKRDAIYEKADLEMYEMRRILDKVQDMAIHLNNHKKVEELYKYYTEGKNKVEEKNSGDKLSFASYKELTAFTGKVNSELNKYLDEALKQLEDELNDGAAPLDMINGIKKERAKLSKSIKSSLKEMDELPTEQILEVKEDKQEDKARVNMISLGDVLDSQMSVIKDQLKGECSDLFKGCCNSITEFRTFLKSGNLDVAKENEFMPKLLKMRQNVAAYYEKNKGTKFTSSGRIRRDMAKAVLKSIEGFISEAPEYILKKFSEDENLVNENSNAGIKAALDYDNLPFEFRDKYRGDLNSIFGKLITNHDGSGATPQMQELKDKIELISRQVKAGNYSGMDEVYVKYLQGKNHNPLISVKTLNFVTRLYKYTDLYEYYEKKASPEMQEAFKRADEAAKRAKGSSADNNIKRQFWPALKPVKYNEDGTPAQGYEKNAEWNDGWIKAYASENVNERAPYLEDIVNEFLEYAERPELFDPEKMEDNLEDVYRLSRLSAVLRDNIFKNSINKQYFESLSQERKDYFLKAYEYASSKIFINTVAQFEMGLDNTFEYKYVVEGRFENEQKMHATLKEGYLSMAQQAEEELGENAKDKTKNVAAYKAKYIKAQKAEKEKKTEENNKKAVESLKLLNEEDKAQGKFDENRVNSMDESTLLLLRTEVKDATTLPVFMRMILGLPATLPPGASKEEDTKKANELIVAFRTISDMMNEDEIVEENGGEEINSYRNMRYTISGEDIGNANDFCKTIKENPSAFGFVKDEEAKEGDLKISALEEIETCIKMHSYQAFCRRSHDMFLVNQKYKKLIKSNSPSDIKKAFKTLNNLYTNPTPDQKFILFGMSAVLEGLMENIKSNKNYIAANNDKMFRKPKEPVTKPKTAAELFDSEINRCKEDDAYVKIMAPTKEDRELVKKNISAVNDKTPLIGIDVRELFSEGITKEDYERIKTVLNKNRKGNIPKEGTPEYKEFNGLLKTVFHEPRQIYSNLSNLQFLTVVGSKEEVKNKLTDKMKARNQDAITGNTDMIKEHRDILEAALTKLDKILG